MNRTQNLARAAASAVGLLVVAAPLSPAAGERLAGGAFHETASFTESDFCDVAGLVVDAEVTLDGRFLERLQGKDKLFYAMDTTRVVIVFTNRATGQQATDIQPRTLFKDLHVTDDGETVTVIVLGTGGGRLLGDDGKLIASGAGQVRFEVVFDSVTGEELSFTQIFGSTGTNDDFCAAILEDWGVTG